MRERLRACSPGGFAQGGSRVFFSREPLAQASVLQDLNIPARLSMVTGGKGKRLRLDGNSLGRGDRPMCPSVMKTPEMREAQLEGSCERSFGRAVSDGAAHSISVA